MSLSSSSLVIRAARKKCNLNAVATLCGHLHVFDILHHGISVLVAGKLLDQTHKYIHSLRQNLLLGWTGPWADSTRFARLSICLQNLSPQDP